TSTMSDTICPGRVSTWPRLGRRRRVVAKAAGIADLTLTLSAARSAFATVVIAPSLSGRRRQCSRPPVGAARLLDRLGQVLGERQPGPLDLVPADAARGALPRARRGIERLFWLLLARHAGVHLLVEGILVLEAARQAEVRHRVDHVVV